jgi:hypothetical protein
MTDHLARRNAPLIDRTTPPSRSGIPDLPSIDFLDARVLATLDGVAMPRQSVVYYVRDERRILISTESKRLKARDVGRSGWASLCVLGPERPHPSAVFSGPAEILTENIGAATAAIIQRIAGLPEPPEARSDEALAANHRRGRDVRQLSADRDRCNSFMNRDSDPRRCCSRRRSTAATATGPSATPQTVPAIVSDG